jgi:hypothetical protein
MRNDCDNNRQLTIERYKKKCSFRLPSNSTRKDNARDVILMVDDNSWKYMKREKARVSNTRQYR